MYSFEMVLVGMILFSAMFAGAIVLRIRRKKADALLEQQQQQQLNSQNTTESPTTPTDIPSTNSTNTQTTDNN